MNGDATSDGLNAMLGDTGDLQTLLIQNIKRESIKRFNRGMDKSSI